MERSKFEEQLKKQLESREIRPSEKAWDRISEQLEVSGQRKASGQAEVSERRKSGRLQWYGIAAGFIGILFVSVLYFTDGVPEENSDSGVSSVGSDSIQRNKSPEVIHGENVPEMDAIVDAEKGDAAIEDTAIEVDETIKLASRQHPDKPLKNAVAGSENRSVEPEKVAIPLNTSEESIQNKIAEIVAQVEVLEKQNTRVTDTEIDSLLRGAQQQLMEDKIFRQVQSVDAMALLADVEGELDRSLRDQLFDALKEGFLKVRTAVADRDR